MLRALFRTKSQRVQGPHTAISNEYTNSVVFRTAYSNNSHISKLSVISTTVDCDKYPLNDLSSLFALTDNSKIPQLHLTFHYKTAGCPTRYRTWYFFNNSNTNEDIATKFEQENVRCVRNEKECVCSVCLLCASVVCVCSVCLLCVCSVCL
jgi:hypothetical protein